uniref:Adaptor protein ClpS core domain-containing protein n=1 Tax=mine drainage metagenome TaxID=410659 RepID=E6PQ12_9ZZZZ
MKTFEASIAEAEVQRPTMKTLVIHNAEDVSFQQVWAVLGQAFHFPIQITRQIALQAHRDGTADVFTASREVIEAKRSVCDRAAETAGCPQLMFSMRDA